MCQACEVMKIDVEILSMEGPAPESDDDISLRPERHVRFNVNTTLSWPEVILTLAAVAAAIFFAVRFGPVIEVIL